MQHPANVPVVRLERLINASPHEVYRAWLDPDTLQRWMAPGGMAVRKAEVDERVGGAIRIFQTIAGADVGGFDGEVVELVPAQRLVFRWGFVGPQRELGPRYDSLLTITFAPAPGGTTRLTLIHERLDDLAKGMPGVDQQVAHGWSFVLNELARVLARSATGT
ncbi:MAG TPA: SRPBCC domain-containing protein [Planctomycetota bacterium]|nr:SRPBCC domain-containing protein [Planctomycetota bacterium]